MIEDNYQYVEDENLLFVEKYRPNTVDECILPDRIKSIFKAFIKKKQFPNLLLTGGPGTGKTTIAKALCKQLGYDYILINASDQRNIDVVRGRIRDFASIASLMGNKKAIILDEADGLNPQSTQPALRAAIEEFSEVRFILTCNYSNKIIEPIKSRTKTIEFSIEADEKTDMSVMFIKRVFEILDKENIPYNKKAVVEVVKQYYPDNRRILGEIQAYSITGQIDEGILSNLKSANIETLIAALKTSSLKEIRQWVLNNSDVEISKLYRDIYDGLYPVLRPNSIPAIILSIAQYQYYSYHVADQEINTMALMMEIVQNAEFK